MNKVYINATSLRSACGNTEQTMYSIFRGKSCLTAFDNIVPQKVVCIGKFPKNNTFEPLLYESVEEVLNLSNLDNYSNTLLLVGSSVGGMAGTEKIFFNEGNFDNIVPQKHIMNSMASLLDERYSFLSTRSFSTACTSSANALKVAKELISVGAYENILVVGADEICLTTIFGFSSLGILSDEICTPFQNERKGMNVAEGIGVLLLQSIYQENSIELVGAGVSSDAYHIANPDPTASGAITAIQKALKDASLSAEKIDYINAHGTGTQANDAAETKAILTLFGDAVHVSSSKSNIGHTLGAAGAIEAIICIESLKKQTLPPQMYCSNNDSFLNFVAKKQKMQMNYALSNSFAFGGNNVSLVFGMCHEN